MEILLCIDDTDNLDSPGTGHLAEILRSIIEDEFDGTTSRITRHQLFVSDDIPYTSHNSTMCFRAEIGSEHLNDTIKTAQNFLIENSAPGSDPGLCVVIPDKLQNREKLICFGKDATHKVLTKNQAYSLAGELGVHLSEHGGTGGGVIGALAGTGLRLSGNNGRFKGWIPVCDEDRTITVEKLCREYDVDEVRIKNGAPLSGDEKVKLTEKVKTVLIDNLSVLPVKENMGMWENIPKSEIKQY